MTAGLLGVPMAWRRACPWLPALVRAGRVLVGPTGELVRITNCGHFEFIVRAGQPWHRSIACDPSAMSRAG